MRHSLPAERDAFVGRATPLRELARRFDAGARLVSVLGIGGTGKTRLAHALRLELARRLSGRRLVLRSVAGARTSTASSRAVAQALDVPLGRDDPVAQLGNAIAGRGRCLVILDNFEQVGAPCRGDARPLARSRRARRASS